MTRFHIKENGEPGECSASVRDCPRGGASEHYATKEAAREAYEKEHEDSSWDSLKKASEEGARRGQVLLKNLDEAYQKQGKEKDLENETKALSAEVANMEK